MRAMASGAPAAIRAARPRASVSRSAAGTTRDTSPMRRRLVGADRVTDERDLRRPGRADEPRQEPRRAAVRHQPDPAEREHEPGIRGAIRRSHAKASDAPAPAATPFTAAITGWPIERSARMIGL